MCHFQHRYILVYYSAWMDQRRSMGGYMAYTLPAVATASLMPRPNPLMRKESGDTNQNLWASGIVEAL